jgi:hypothetical protein
MLTKVEGLLKIYSPQVKDYLVSKVLIPSNQPDPQNVPRDEVISTSESKTKRIEAAGAMTASNYVEIISLTVFHNKLHLLFIYR